MEHLNSLIQEKFDQMSDSGKLFRAAITGDQIWDLYLSSFSKENDPVFRDPASSTHNCNHCNNFIRRYGNIVSIGEDLQIQTMFDLPDVDEEYAASVNAISAKIKSSKIEEVFFETFQELNSLPYESCTKKSEKFQLGVASNQKRYTKEESEKYGVVDPGEIIEFKHLHLFLDKKFVDTTGLSVETIMANYRESKNVFQRAMETISLDTLRLVKDLILQGSLLNGDPHIHKIDAIIQCKDSYDSIDAKNRDNWCWVQSFGFSYARFRNELIGVLCSELSEGMDLNKACENWNKRVDPVNYKKASAPITKSQIDAAKKFVEENGYEESFDRTLATIDDIKVSEILHTNVGDGKIKEVSIFDEVKSNTSRHKRNEFDGVEEVDIEKFMKDILPGCTSVEAYLENRYDGNFVTLTTSKVKESKPIFAWSNNYSWTFNGNLSGKSQIKSAVKSRGGNVDGVLRISLSFPLTTDDYDLHVEEPNGNRIDYKSVRSVFPSSGTLDLDAQGVDGPQPPEKRVENVIYVDKSKMLIGRYIVRVHNFSRRGLNVPFDLEVEADGELTLMSLKRKTRDNWVDVVIINFDGNSFTVKPSSSMEIKESKSVSKEVYGLQTNQFHKVNLLCLSPNHWGENKVGNKHYFFMLNGCKTPVPIRGFHNENLNAELSAHRKVLEVLALTKMIEPSDKQLSGLGFNATVRDELIVRLQGTHKRCVKIKF